jgi:hypothetical protein
MAAVYGQRRAVRQPESVLQSTLPDRSAPPVGSRARVGVDRGVQYASAVAAGRGWGSSIVVTGVACSSFVPAPPGCLPPFFPSCCFLVTVVLISSLVIIILSHGTPPHTHDRALPHAHIHLLWCFSCVSSTSADGSSATMAGRLSVQHRLMSAAGMGMQACAPAAIRCTRVASALVSAGGGGAGLWQLSP